MFLTLMSLALQFEQGSRMNVFEAPGRKTKSDATLMACDTSVEVPFPDFMCSK